MDCIFCKIISKEIPAHIIYEDENTLAFADIKPNNLGHTLVIPKKHSTNIFDTPDATLSQVIITAKKVAEAVKKATGAEGINIGINNEPAAGQLVFHSHVHVIPRFSNDGFVHWKGAHFEPEQIKEAAEKIRSKLS